MVKYICIYFISSTYVHRGSDVLSSARVPHRIVKMSDNLGVTGCNQCIFITPEHKERALSALNEAGVKYFAVKEAARL